MRGTLTAQDAARLADIAQARGALTAQDAARLTEIGQARGALTSQDATRILEGAQLTGQLTGQDASRIADIAQARGALVGQDASRIAQLGQITGQLTQQDASTLADIGLARGELSQQDAAILQTLASKYLGLGEAAQTLGLTGAEAITGVGAKERGMQQANLDLAYQDFLRQEQYPKDQIKFLSDVLKGVSLPETTITQETTTPAMPGGPSNINKAITGITGITELLKLFGAGGDLGDLFKKYLGGNAGTSTTGTSTTGTSTGAKPVSRTSAVTSNPSESADYWFNVFKKENPNSSDEILRREAENRAAYFRRQSPQ